MSFWGLETEENEEYDKVLLMLEKELEELNDESDDLESDDEMSLYKIINFEPTKSPNSQNLPDVVKLNFAVNILSTELMFKKKSLIGDNPFFFKLDQIEGFDINTNYDFEFAEFLFKKYRQS